MTELAGANGLGWTPVWEQVAARLGSHRAAGRGHLLTEDTLAACPV